MWMSACRAHSPSKVSGTTNVWVKELELSNWMLIQKAHLYFSLGQDVIGVVARYADSETGGQSNRAGKTSIVEAIRYLLFGKGRSGQGVKLVNRAARAQGEGFYLHGVFVLRDGTTLDVERTRDHKGKPSASVNGVDMKSAEADDLIQLLLGWTVEEFDSAANFKQGDVHKFMESQPREKRSLLISWMNLGRWEERRAHAAAKAALYASKVEVAQTALDSIPVAEKSIQELGADVDVASGNLIKSKRTKTVYQQRVEKLRGELEEAAGNQRLGERIERLSGKLERYKGLLKKAVGNAEKAVALGSEKDALVYKRDKMLVEHRNVVSGYIEEIVTVKAKVETLKAKADALEENEGVCPVLGEPCDRIGNNVYGGVGSDLAEASAELSALKSRKTDSIRDKGALEKTYDSRILERRTEISELGNTDADYFKNEVERIEDSLADAEEEYDEDTPAPEGVTEELGAAIVKARGAETDVENNTRALALAEAELKTAEGSQKRLAKLERRLKTARSHLSSWTYCTYMFSNRGIPGEYISSAFETLEGDVNHILRRMDTGLQVEFKPYRTGKKKEAHCLACGYEFQPREKRCPECAEARHLKQVEQLVLNIRDEREAQESEFDMDSGGGKVLISFAVRLALLMLKVRESGGEVPPIVLDEVVGFLDPVNRAAMIDVVVNILTQEFGVQQIWWISHSEEILDMINNHIVVTRHGDYSTVDWN